MGQILLAGQWVGEFGWELFCWQGYVRNLATHYDKVIVVSRPTSEFLYKDFADEFIGIDAPASKANMWLGESNQQKVTEIIRKYNPNQHLQPFNIGYTTGSKTFISDHKFNQQKYIKYKSDSLDKKYDILLHARNKIVGSNRNWDKQKWVELISLLSKNYKIATIGSSEAFGFDGIDDYRNCSIEDSVSLMNRCKLVVGQSSGPLHLASLSGAPHFVWSDSSNNLRYNEHWNPFNTKNTFYDKEGWNPKPQNIFEEIMKNI